MSQTKPLSPAQTLLLKQCLGGGAVILSGRERRTAALLQDRGLLAMNGRKSYGGTATVWEATITDAGRVAVS